jgi:hypothetical protein
VASHKPERRPTARAAFLARAAEFDDLMAKLDAHRARNFNARTDVDWGDVGSLGYVIERLRDALEHYGVR